MLQGSAAPDPGPLNQAEMRGGDGGNVKNVNLLPTMSIPSSKIVMRVGEGVLDVYILNKKDPKGIGTVWKDGDVI